MRYSTAGHVVNVIFIAAIFIAPIAYCLSDPSIPIEIGRAIIVSAFFLGVFAIADWYHFHLCNSLSGLLIAIAGGATFALVALVIAAAATTTSLSDLALFRSIDGWGGHRWLWKSYLVGLGVCSTALVGIPRLFVLTLVSRQPLPWRSDP